MPLLRCIPPCAEAHLGPSPCTPHHPYLTWQVVLDEARYRRELPQLQAQLSAAGARGVWEERLPPELNAALQVGLGGGWWDGWWDGWAGSWTGRWSRPPGPPACSALHVHCQAHARLKPPPPLAPCPLHHRSWAAWRWWPRARATARWALASTSASSRCGRWRRWAAQAKVQAALAPALDASSALGSGARAARAAARHPGSQTRLTRSSIHPRSHRPTHSTSTLTTPPACAT